LNTDSGAFDRNNARFYFAEKLPFYFFVASVAIDAFRAHPVALVKCKTGDYDGNKYE
jgi:hypothetical protein